MVRMKKIQVLQVNKLYYPVTGGIEKVVQDIAEGFREDPLIESQVLVCQAKGKGMSERVNGVSVTRCRSLGTVCSLPISFSFLWKFKKFSSSMDIIHIHVPFPMGDLACLLSGYQGRVVVWWHSDVIRQKRLMKLYYPIMVGLLKRADKIVVATRGHIDGSLYLTPYREKCCVIPFGVDQELIADADLYLNNKRDNEKGDGKIIKFLFAGRLVYYKGCDILIKAFARLEQKNVRLTVIGDGVLREAMEGLAKELDVDDKIDFLGEVEREVMLGQFAECDIFVLPSVAPSEAFGIVQIEAMAYGKPVINTYLKSGVPYVSIHEKTGLTVEAGHVSQLAQAMERLITNPQLREEYGKAAAERVREYFNMDFMLDQLKGLYKELMDGKADTNGRTGVEDCI